MGGKNGIQLLVYRWAYRAKEKKKIEGDSEKVVVENFFAFFFVFIHAMRTHVLSVMKLSIFLLNLLEGKGEKKGKLLNFSGCREKVIV